MKHFQLPVCIFTPCVALLIFIILSSAAGAAQVTLAWDPNDPKPDVYKVYRRGEGNSYDYSSPAWTGTAAMATIDNLDENTTYFFVVRAYVDSQESGDSNEVEIIPATSNTDSSSTAVAVNITVTLDNGDLGTSGTGSWIVSGGTNPYGSNSLYSKDAGARYTFSSQASGRYEVRLWWTDYASRCSDVPVRIYDDNTLLKTVYVDQSQNGGKWNSLGDYDFSGVARVEVLSLDNSCSTCADAAQFYIDVEDDDDTIRIIDDGDTGTLESGQWLLSGGIHPYGSRSLYSKDTSSRYTFAFELSGRYEISLWWTDYASRCARVPVRIYDDNTLLKTVYVDQSQNGGKWNSLGDYDFSGVARVVVLSRDSGCSTCADAVQYSK